MYETKRAFTYLLLKESVANDVINVSLFAQDKITLKTQNVNKTRQDIDKKCLGIKKYGVKRLIKEFPKRNGVSVVLRTFRSDCEQRGPLNEHPVVNVSA